MKKLALMAIVAMSLTACGTTAQRDSYTAKVVDNQVRVDKAAEDAVSKAPSWMSKLPKSESAVYENGTATSIDFGMADMKAKAIAYAKICIAAGGKIRSQTKIFRSESETSSTEASELAIRSICPDIDITGVETVEMKHVADAGRIRSYVLVALPIGPANTMRKEADSRKDKASAVERSTAAFKELDTVVTGKKAKPAVIQLPHETISDPTVKSKVEAAIERGDAVILTDTVR